MVSPREWLPPSRRWTFAILGGGLVSGVYTAIITGYSIYPHSNVDITTPVWETVAVSLVSSFGTIGVPVALWLRFRLRGPLVLAGAVLLFWHVLVEFPPIGSGHGDAPGFMFVFLLAPLYVVAYGVLAGVEYWLRGLGGSPATHRA